MIGKSSSNIYLSATKEDYQELDPEQAQHYRRPQKTWLISVEPHKHSIPFVPRHQHEATHFVATKQDDENTYSVKEHSKDGIIGAILLAEAVHCTSEDIRQKLQDGLQTSTGSSLPSEIPEDGESDHWIRRAIHLLQDHGVVERFDVGEFMTFAHVCIHPPRSRKKKKLTWFTVVRGKPYRRRRPVERGISRASKGTCEFISSFPPVSARTVGFSSPSYLLTDDYAV